MKKIKALISFGGIVSLRIGEEREVTDEVAKDLIKAGYAEEIKKEAPTKRTAPKKQVKYEN